MTRKKFFPESIRCFLEQEKIATLEELKRVLGTSSTMTVSRNLKELNYLSSYSHRGKYYTLIDIADFDELGLWSFRFKHFSRYGNLVETAYEFVVGSEMGYTTRELESLLYVECKRALLALHKQERIVRKDIAGVYTYFSADPRTYRRQLSLREAHAVDGDLIISSDFEVITHELKAAIVLFYSMLDEKQRRLYAGLEAYKLGHSGDQKISEFLGIDRHTVAKGRRELFSGDVEREGIRKEGGGRKAKEKKRRKL